MLGMVVGRVALAQSATIVGTVHVAGDSLRHLRDVDVLLEPSDRKARTDSVGAFRFVGVTAGAYLVRVRRIGLGAVTH